MIDHLVGLGTLDSGRFHAPLSPTGSPSGPESLFAPSDVAELLAALERLRETAQAA